MNLRKKIAEGFAVVLILALAGWLRFHDLGTNPPGVFRDEAEKALNAWALARTGQAFEFVQGPGGYPKVAWLAHPLFIHVFGVETSSIYQWALSLLSHQDHPPTPFQLRVPAATAGVLSVLAVYAITRLLFGPTVALLAALFLAISPWSIVFSRWALQGAFIPLFITLGAGGVMLGKRRYGAWYLLGAFGLGMAFYTYSGARPFVLAFVAVSAMLQWKSLLDRRKLPWAIAAISLFFLLIAPALAAMTAPGGTARFERISVFGGGRSTGEALAAMARSYFVHFSPGFLFLHGDPQPRHGVQSFGVLYHIEFLFALIGLVALFVAQAFQPAQRDRLRETDASKIDPSADNGQAGKPAPQLRWIVFAWLLLFPVGAMLTNPAEMPHALRTIVLLPLPQILAAYGVVATMRYLRERERLRRELGIARRGVRFSWVVATLTALLVAASTGGFGVVLFRYYPRYSAREWESGFGDALAVARERTDKGASVAISGSIALAPYLILYYDGTPPEKLRQMGWDALNAVTLPFSQREFGEIWRQMPKGWTLVALFEDNLSNLAFPIYIAHPPAPKQSDREQLPVTYVVYKKN